MDGALYGGDVGQRGDDPKRDFRVAKYERRREHKVSFQSGEYAHTGGKAK